jgi:hypothetical protein
MAKLSLAFTNPTNLRFKSAAIDITRRIYATERILRAGIGEVSGMGQERWGGVTEVTPRVPVAQVTRSDLWLIVTV